MATKEELIARLAECVLEMEDEEVVDVANEYIEAGYEAYDGIMEGLVAGMNKASDLYDAEEYFVTDVLLCSDAMYAGLDVLRPHLPAVENTGDVKKAVIGVVEGDTHDIGKNLVKIMLEASGYEMIDLGRDVPIQEFVDAVVNDGARAVALSTLMSTSMPNMAKVVQKLEEAGVRDQVKVIVGGGPLSSGYARKIGADGYSDSAVEAVELLDGLMGW